MAASSGFAINISAVDGASKTLDSINKRIGALRAPADRFNRSLAKFSDVTGITRMAEGVSTLGDRALGTARAIERMASPMAAITSAASIAGMVEFSRRWADAGNQVGKAAYQFNMPVGQLGALRGAARLAGSSTEAMDSSLQGLGQTLSNAHWGRDPAAISTLNALHIGFHGANGQARQASDALGDVADAISKYKDARTQTRVLEQLGISPDMLPLLKNGRQGLEDFRKQAMQTGGVMTGQMVKNATEMNHSWTELGLAIEGVGNRLENKYAPAVTSVIERSAKWIENNKAAADSIAGIGASISVLMAIKPAAWLLRLLGLGGLAGAVGTGAVLAAPLTLGGDTPSDPALNQPPTSPGFFGQGGTLERWLSAPARSGAFPGGTNAPAPSRSLPPDVKLEIRKEAQKQGVAPGLVIRLAGAAEGANPGVSPKGAQGWMQLMPKTAAGLGVDPANQHQNIEGGVRYYKQLLERYAGNSLDAAAAYNAGPNAIGMNHYVETGDPSQLPLETQRYLRAFDQAAQPSDAGRQYVGGMQGNVHVTVDVRHDGKAATAAATASGAATVSPPRVEKSMAHAQ